MNLIVKFMFNKIKINHLNFIHLKNVQFLISKRFFCEDEESQSRTRQKQEFKNEKLMKYCFDNNLVHPFFKGFEYRDYKRSLNQKSNQEIKERLLKENDLLDNYYQYNFHKYKNVLAYKDYDFKNINKSLIKRFDTSDYTDLSNTNILIVGGGLIGTAIAYYLKSYIMKSNSIHVIDKDLTYSNSTSLRSLGILHQQFTSEELIYMAKFSATFLRKCIKELSIQNKTQPNLNYYPVGNLVLIKEEDALERIEIIKKQIELGLKINILNKDELLKCFPWLNISDDIVLGSISLYNEGYFDPIALLNILRSKAEHYGVKFYEAELIDFNPENKKVYNESRDYFDLQIITDCIIKTKFGDLFNINFDNIILAVGSKTCEMCDLLQIGNDKDDYFRGCPSFLKERKQKYYKFLSVDGPGIDFPFLVDPSGVFCKSDSISGQYICSKISKVDETDCDKENDDLYFEKEIKPILINRVPSFKNLEIIDKWYLMEEINTFDNLPLIGGHPYYSNVIFVGGLGIHSPEFAPAIGRYITDRIYNAYSLELPLERFGWERLLMNYKLEEKMFF